MISVSEVYIHLGLPRTGSTFLQRNVFPKLDLHYVSKPGTVSGGKFIDVRGKEGKFLFSNENWSGWLYKETSNERYAMLQWFKERYPDAHIMLCTRDTDAWLKSIKNNQWKKEPNYDLEQYDRQMLDTDTYVKTINTLFKGNLIFDYDEFKKDNKAMVGKMCKWLDVPLPSDISYKIVNQSWSKQQVQLAHFIKKLKKYSFERILGGI